MAVRDVVRRLTFALPGWAGLRHCQAGIASIAWRARRRKCASVSLSDSRTVSYATARTHLFSSPPIQLWCAATRWVLLMGNLYRTRAQSALSVCSQVGGATRISYLRCDGVSLTHLSRST